MSPTAAMPFAVEVLSQFRAKLVDKSAEPARERARRDWRYFTTNVLGFELEWFHEDAFDGQIANRETLTLAPRGHGKSTILTVAFSLWQLVRDPNVRILIVSDTGDLAEEFTGAMRAIIESRRWTDLFGQWRGNPWTNGAFTINRRTEIHKEASVTAGSIRGGIVGGHYDLVICDDLVSEESASSEKLRAKTRQKFLQTLRPTLMPGARLHIVGTRYHYQDLYGELERAGYSFRRYQAIQPDGSALWEKFQPLDDVLDGDGKVRVKGLNSLRRDMGTILFNAQYQNDTSAMQGKVFKPDWIVGHAYMPEEIDGFDALPKVIGVDPAIGQKRENDHTALACLRFDRKNNVRYLVEVVQGRWTPDEQVAQIKAFYRRHNTASAPVVRIGIEAVAYQDALRQIMQRGSNLPVVPIRPHRDKVTRAQAESADFENGRLRWPRNMLNGGTYEEFILFPDCEHDDRVDAVLIANRVAARGGGARTGRKPRGF